MPRETFFTDTLPKLIVVGVILVVVIFGPSSLMAPMFVRTAPNTDTTRLSERSFYRVSYVTTPSPPVVSQPQRWMLHVETASGQPVDNANIAAKGNMPEHGLTLSPPPQEAQRLGGGNYVLENIKFQTAGWWVLTVQIEVSGQSDQVIFNLILP
ncbi:MAG: FixH family protein [Chloroflexi bacterium]|nr:FixH family protein [Chloroflexota bacterium]